MNFKRKVRRSPDYLGNVPMAQPETVAQSFETDIRKRGRAYAAMLFFGGLVVGFAVAALLASCAQSATLRFSCTAPTLDNDAPGCMSPVLVAGADSVYVIASVPALGIRDSVKAARGARLTFAYPAPAGNYAVTVHASRVVGGNLFAGCDTTASIAAVPNPWKVTLR